LVISQAQVGILGSELILHNLKWELIGRLVGWQVVALNSTYEASGELYIDDGKSYDFEQGAFIHRQFKFSKGRLTSTILAPVKTGSKVFTTSCLVERIVILGVRAKDLTIGKNAIVEQDERRIETDIGPPLLQRGASSTALILRLPNVHISDNWSIKLV